ncbi:hypothetical protein JAAARDRAFT_643968 [Jaapia argillacea MUCL 33604]|uniref:Uncharacterized protein n=1 Tax=Jaapia argillacea MUCL 33604 TaxID=933084 RepID=A0A067PG98_9AGAM|nr:hypothetical protein JAAARDRAFT_643968 [Jaapia argillacea MUCL 33604]
MTSRNSYYGPSHNLEATGHQALQSARSLPSADSFVSVQPGRSLFPFILRRTQASSCFAELDLPILSMLRGAILKLPRLTPNLLGIAARLGFLPECRVHTVGPESASAFAHIASHPQLSRASCILACRYTLRCQRHSVILKDLTTPFFSSTNELVDSLDRATPTR